MRAQLTPLGVNSFLTFVGVLGYLGAEDLCNYVQCSTYEGVTPAHMRNPEWASPPDASIANTDPAETTTPEGPVDVSPE